MDLNVFVSAALGSPSCRAITAAVVEGRVTPVVSSQFLTELRQVLSRPKFRAVLTPASIEELLQVIESRAILINPRQALQISRDPDDNHLFSLAIEGGAGGIVSSDADVLEALPIGGLAVWSVREFLTQLK